MSHVVNDKSPYIHLGKRSASHGMAMDEVSAILTRQARAEKLTDPAQRIEQLAKAKIDACAWLKRYF